MAADCNRKNLRVNCFRCEKKLPDGAHQCRNCKAWNWGQAFKVDESVLFEDVVSSDEDRIKTVFLDDNLGGGLVRTDVILLGGTPGAGKSTLLLQVADIFCAEGECVYVAGEEALKAIKARGVRLGIAPRRRLRLVNAMGGVADIGEVLANHKPAGVIIDSINALVGQDHEAEIKCLEVLKKYAVLLNSPVLVISQVNKDGDYSGLMAKQHAVDCLLTLMPDDDIETAGGERLRVVETLKNRSGPAFVRSFFEMTARGLVRVEPDDSEETDGPASEPE